MIQQFSKLLICVVCVCSLQISNAQLWVGAKGGLNIAKIKSAADPNTTYSALIAPHFGATTKFAFSNRFGLQADVLYSMQGSKRKSVVKMANTANSSTITTTTNNTYNFNYISIPIYANLEIPIKSDKLVPYRLKEHVVSFHLYGGGFFGYGISMKNTQTVNTLEQGDDNTVMTNTTVKTTPALTKIGKIDFGITFGAGFSFVMSESGRLFVDGRYNMGFANINSAKAIVGTDGKYAKMNNTFPQISIGYMHRITPKRRFD